MNQWQGYSQSFPPDTEVLAMTPSELGPFVLRYMTRAGAAV
jgi:hypothetical protein